MNAGAKSTTPRLITFDSGQGSHRRPLIQSLLQYLVGVRGIKAVCLSTRGSVTKAYLALLPPRLKQEIFSLGSFQIYLQVTEHVNDLHELLFLNPSHNRYIFDLYQKILYPIQDGVIRDLQKIGLVVILDRSRLSAHGYYANLPTFVAPSLHQTLQAGVEYSRHTANVRHIFVESRARLGYTILNAQKYDLIAPQLNLKLKAWFNNLNHRLSKAELPEILFIPADAQMQWAIQLIKRNI